MRNWSVQDEDVRRRCEGAVHDGDVVVDYDAVVVIICAYIIRFYYIHGVP